MLPSRPRSRPAAASSARTDGADPSYPTTRYRSPVVGMAVFIRTPGCFHASERIAVLAGGSWQAPPPVRPLDTAAACAHVLHHHRRRGQGDKQADPARPRPEAPAMHPLAPNLSHAPPP